MTDETREAIRVGLNVFAGAFVALYVLDVLTGGDLHRAAGQVIDERLPRGSVIGEANRIAQEAAQTAGRDEAT